MNLGYWVLGLGTLFVLLFVSFALSAVGVESIGFMED